MNPFPRTILLALSLSACFDPRFRSPVACGELLSCPPDTYCHVATMTCESTPDVLGGLDAGTDGPIEDPRDAAEPDGALPDATPDAGGPCSLVPQAGCATGDKCTIDYWTETGPSCVKAGPLASEALCARDDECLSGTTCLGRCRAFCSLDGSCPGLVCADIGQPEVGVCLPACDPTVDRVCGNDAEGIRACYIAGKVAACMPMTEAKQVDQPCHRLADCRPGAGCHGGVCRLYCAPARGDLDCPASVETCRPLGGGYGICAPEP